MKFSCYFLFNHPGLSTVQNSAHFSNSISTPTSQRQSYFTTCGLQPISSSWRQARWDSRPDFVFSNWTLAVIVLMQHPLWREDGFVSYEYPWPFVRRTYRTYSILLKMSSFCTTHRSSLSTGFTEQIMPILRILCYNGSLVTWTVVGLTTAKFKPLLILLPFLLPLAWVSEWVGYITTDGQSASLSWCRAPIWGLWPDFYYCLTIEDLLRWGALSDERTVLSFTMYNVQYVYILHVILRYSFTNLI
jgi:hypothetical protein